MTEECYVPDCTNKATKFLRFPDGSCCAFCEGHDILLFDSHPKMVEWVDEDEFEVMKVMEY
jgi:hypothetical protein